MWVVARAAMRRVAAPATRLEQVLDRPAGETLDPALRCRPAALAVLPWLPPTVSGLSWSFLDERLPYQLFSQKSHQPEAKGESLK
jgi:hypothetical protein